MFWSVEEERLAKTRKGSVETIIGRAWRAEQNSSDRPDVNYCGLN